MLESIRNTAQGWVAWVIVGFIAIPFLLWGIWDYLGPAADPTVVTVNGKNITTSRVNREYEQLRRQQPDQTPNDELLRQQALQRLISEVVFYDHAQAQGYQASDEQVRDMILSFPIFQEDGVFSKPRLEDFLIRQGWTQQVLVEQVRKQMLVDQAQQGIRQSAFVLDQEVEQALSLLFQSRDIAVLTIPVTNFIDAVDVAEADIQDYYQNNEESFQNQEQVKLSYIRVLSNDLLDSIQPDDDEIQAYYEANADRYTRSARRNAAHILIEHGDNSDAAREQASALLARVQAGEDFAELASSFSQDLGSAGNGGELGWFETGDIVLEFEQAGFALTEPGSLSELVESDFGYHIIKLIAAEEQQLQPLTEVLTELTADLQQEQAQQAFIDLREQLAALAYEQPDSLQGVAEELALEIQTTEFFNRETAPALFTQGNVLDVVFSDAVLIERENSELIEVNPSEVLVVRAEDYQAASLKSLDEVRSDIEQRLRQNQAQAEAETLSEALLARLNAGESADTVAADAGSELRWETYDKVQRNRGALDPLLLKQAFKLPHPVEQPQYTTVSLFNGDSALVAVSAVHAAEYEDSEREQFQSLLENMYLQQEVSRYAQAAEQQADIAYP